MLVDGMVYVNDAIVERALDQEALVQVANVATLPGIVGRSLAMPDIHWGYGFPIGGVAAFDVHSGVVSPGGVGYDINCGVRLLRTSLRERQVRPRLRELVAALFQSVPTGVGASHKGRLLGRSETREVAEKGARWAVEQGFGSPEDLDYIEEGGCLRGAEFSEVSQRAYERGRGQLGTLGSGNHFVEVEVVDEVYDSEVANVFGLLKGHVVATIHTGSRGFGHQVCTDFIPLMARAARQARITLPDRQLACAPIESSEGQSYLAAMAAAANYAFANRQMITHLVRRAFERVFGRSWEEMGIRVVYDVAHNIAKTETHHVGGRKVRVCVHRKGATRALPAGHRDVPEPYRRVGQPVLVPGDMGRMSYVLVGKPRAMDETFGSSCHGAGRLLSRRQAIRQGRRRDVRRDLEEQGIIVMATGSQTLAEEMPAAYKDVLDVVQVVHDAGIAARVARIRPLGVIKG